MQLTPGELIDIIHSCKFFAKIPIEKIVEILPEFKIVELEPGATLFSQGDTSDYIYVLLKGELISVLTRSSGKKIIIGTVRPVETVGELGAFSGEHRSLTVEAIMRCELLQFSAKKFREFCQYYPAMQTEISELTIARSMKTIKMMYRERKYPNVHVVVSFVEDASQMKIMDKLVPLIKDTACRILESDKADPQETIQQIAKAEESSIDTVVMMSALNFDVLEVCVNAHANFYLMFNEGEVVYKQESAQSFLDFVKAHPMIRFELVLFHPENAKKLANTRKWLQLAKFSMHHHVRINNQKDFERISRFITGNAFALVLGGGGAKGLVHLGVIKAILDNGLHIDAVGGTSIGASVSACYAASLNFQTMLTYINKLKKATRKSLSIFNMTWPTIALYSSNPATSELKSVFGDDCIEDFWIPFFAVSSSLTKMNQVVHSRGFIWEALRCSASVPGVYPPYVMNGELLLDGGLINNLPVDVMRNLVGSHQKIMAVSLATIGKEKPNFNFPPVVTLWQSLLTKLGIGYRDYIYPPFLEMLRESLLVGSSSMERQNALDADVIVKPDLSGFKMLSAKARQEQEMFNVGYREGLIALDLFLKANPTYKRKKP